MSFWTSSQAMKISFFPPLGGKKWNLSPIRGSNVDSPSITGRKAFTCLRSYQTEKIRGLDHYTIYSFWLLKIEPRWPFYVHFCQGWVYSPIHHAAAAVEWGECIIPRRRQNSSPIFLLSSRTRFRSTFNALTTISAIRDKLSDNSPVHIHQLFFLQRLYLMQNMTRIPRGFQVVYENLQYGINIRMCLTIVMVPVGY